MSNPEINDMAFVIDDPFYGRIAPDTNDVLFRYGNPIYDHIRYHEPVRVNGGAEGDAFTRIRGLFVGASILDLLAKYGVPETYVDKPTSVVVETYERDQMNRFEKELEGNDESAGEE